MDRNHLNNYEGRVWYIRIVPVKFGKIKPLVLEEMPFETCKDDATRTSNDHNSSHQTFGSGELIYKLKLFYDCNTGIYSLTKLP